MSHVKNNEASTDNGKNELFSFRGNVSELMMAHANMKHKKPFKEMAFVRSHASLFHFIHSLVKSWRKTAGSDNTPLKSQKYDQIYLHVPQDAPGTATGAQENKDTSKPVHSKHLSAPENKNVILKRQRKHLGELSPARMLPYLVLISRCIPLPVSDIESRCLKGQILCRIQYFTLRRSKKKLLPQPAWAKLPISKSEITPTTYVTFDGLKDLQWKLYKGLAKRKPKVTGMWREPNFSTGLMASLPGSYEEYLLPLIPRDWIIDDSLKYKVPLPISASMLQYQTLTVREWGAVTDILGSVFRNCTSTSQSWILNSFQGPEMPGFYHIITVAKRKPLPVELLFGKAAFDGNFCGPYAV